MRDWMLDLNDQPQMIEIPVFSWHGSCTWKYLTSNIMKLSRLLVSVLKLIINFMKLSGLVVSVLKLTSLTVRK